MSILPEIILFNCITPLWSCMYICALMKRPVIEPISEYALNQPMVYASHLPLKELVALYKEEDFI